VFDLLEREYSKDKAWNGLEDLKVYM